MSVVAASDADRVDSHTALGCETLKFDMQVLLGEFLQLTDGVLHRLSQSHRPLGSAFRASLMPCHSIVGTWCLDRLS